VERCCNEYHMTHIEIQGIYDVLRSDNDFVKLNVQLVVCKFQIFGANQKYIISSSTTGLIRIVSFIFFQLMITSFLTYTTIAHTVVGARNILHEKNPKMFGRKAIRCRSYKKVTAQQRTSPDTHGRRKGGRGALAPLDFEIWHFLIKFLAKTVVFLVSGG